MCMLMFMQTLLLISVKVELETSLERKLLILFFFFICGQQFFPFSTYINRNVFWIVLYTCTGFILIFEVSLCHYYNNFDQDKTLFSYA